MNNAQSPLLVHKIPTYVGILCTNKGDCTLFSLHFKGHCSGEPGLAGFTGAKDDGDAGDNWSYKTRTAPVKLSPPTNQFPSVLRHSLLVG